jgi:glycosyltransferase involved in cell wall biosynthesis
MIRVALLAPSRPACGVSAYTDSLARHLRLAGEIDLHVEPLPLTRPLDQTALERVNVCDLVHLQHEYSFWGSVLPGKNRFPLDRARIRPPLVVTAHTLATPEEMLAVAGAPGISRLARVAMARWPPVRRAVERDPFDARAVIVHTQEVAVALRSRGLPAGQVHVLPMPVPDRPERTPALPAALGDHQNRLVVLPGRLTPEKGADILLDALPHLPADAAAVVAGGPPPGHEEVVATLAARAAALGLSGRFTVTGALPDSELWAYVREAAVVTLPYRSGTGSYAAGLAAAAGAPLVASDLPVFAGFGEIRRFAAGDARALAAVLCDVLADPAEHERLREVSRAYASAHSWAAAAGWHARLYQQVLSGT